MTAAVWPEGRTHHMGRNRELLSFVPCALLAFLLGCDGNFCPEDCGGPPPSPVPQTIPPPNSPENVIEAIEIIYNDKVRSARERSEAYASLFEPAFIFHFQGADVAHGLPETWQLEQELAAHSRLFDAQERGNIYSVELVVRHGPAIGLIPSELGSAGWKEVFASYVYMRVMTNLEDGFEVNGGRAVFVFSPPSDGNWQIAAWMDLPGPTSEEESAVESVTWGQIKWLLTLDGRAPVALLTTQPSAGGAH